MLLEYEAYIIGFSTLIISSFLTWFVFYKQRKIKNLSFSIVDIKTVIDSENILNNDIEFLYKKNKVDYLEILTIRLTNNGNLPITKNDFIKSVKIDFGEAQILSSRFEDVDQLETDVNLKKLNESNCLKIRFDLLNPGESIEFEVYLNSKGTIKVSGRIIGVHKINYLEKTNYLIIVFISFTLLLSLVLFISMLFINIIERFAIPNIIGYIIYGITPIQVILFIRMLFFYLPKKGVKRQIDLDKLRRIAATNSA